jgi:hypothetical protein
VPILTPMAQLRLRLLWLMGHAHFAVHPDRSGEVLLDLLAIAPAAVKFAETWQRATCGLTELPREH